MARRSKAYVICSDRPRAGKTLFARVLVEFLKRFDEMPGVFDTNVPAGELITLFPKDTTLLSFERIRGQMALLDAIIANPGRDYVIDLSDRITKLFFQTLDHVGFIEEAKTHGLDVVVFFILDGSPASAELAEHLVDTVPKAPIVLIENRVRSETDKRTGVHHADPGLQGLLRMDIPDLDPIFINAINRPGFTFQDFFPAGALPLAPEGPAIPASMTHEIRRWLEGVTCQINQIHMELRLEDLMTDRS